MLTDDTLCRQTYLMATGTKLDLASSIGCHRTFESSVKKQAPTLMERLNFLKGLFNWRSKGC
jgi:hypothetical protein